MDRFTGKGGTFVRGHGDASSGPAGSRWATRSTWPAAVVVIATGTAAVIPPIDGLAGTPYWTNREAVEAETLPRT